MTAKHTPLPWEVRIHDKGPYFTKVEIWHQNYGCLAIMSDNTSIWNSDKNETIALEALNQTIANAKVMVAGPELLKALEVIRDLIDRNVMVRNISKDFNIAHFTKQGVEINNAIFLMNEAIKKAKP